jgi:glycerate 2-kinase
MAIRVRRVMNWCFSRFPMAGPAFCGVMGASSGAESWVISVTNPRDIMVPANLVMVGQDAYVESAQACGLSLLDPPLRDPRVQHTSGVGEAIIAALSAGARRITVGIGGTATIDAGAGLLAALGATARGYGALDSDSATTQLLRGGPGGFSAITSVDIAPALQRVQGVELIAAVDVDVPLTGPNGAVRGFGRQKFKDPDSVSEAVLDDLDQSISAFAETVQRCGDAQGSSTDHRLVPGAGAGGGLGWALSLLGAELVSGADLCAQAVGLPDAAAAVDLIITGEGRLDWQSLRGKVIDTVASVGEGVGRPVLVIAGSVDIGHRELAARGITEARALVDGPGGRQAAMDHPADAIAALAARLASQWSRQ